MLRFSYGCVFLVVLIIKNEIASAAAINSLSTAINSLFMEIVSSS